MMSLNAALDALRSKWIDLFLTGGIVLVLLFLLDLTSYNLSVPFVMESDANIQLMYIKSLLDNGWTFDIPQLSAPFSLSGAGFPVATNSDWAVMKVLAAINPNPGWILNVYWLVSVLMSGLTAAYCLRVLGVTSLYAAMGGLLYAFLPYAILRNVSHLNLVYYPVPLLATFALYIVNPGVIKASQRRRFLIVSLLGCLFQGFNYIYYSFFAALLFLFAFLISGNKREVAVPALAGFGLLCLSGGINMIPSFWSWHTHGAPPDLGYKSAPEAEVYGAKFRKMIAPYPGNPVPLLNRWGKRDVSAHFPYDDNESRSARMGLIASMGFLGLLGLTLGILKTHSALMNALSRLALFVFLMITVGGGGALFNLLTIPDIRCYNRFVVFLSFFCFVAAFAWLSRICASTWRSKGLYLLVAGLVLLSFYDQTLEIYQDQLLVKREKTTGSYANHRAAISLLEGQMKAPSGVFMLPLTDFPIDGGRHDMGIYAHAIPYLFSSRIRWSWPSFSYRHKFWLDRVNTLKGRERLEYLVLSGFNYVWINRLGYADRGESTIKEYLDAGGRFTPKGSVEPFEIIDLGGIEYDLLARLGSEEFQREQQTILNSPVVSLEKGFHGQEVGADGSIFRWVRGKSSLRVFNFEDRRQSLELSMAIVKHQAPGQMIVRCQGVEQRFEIGEGKQTIRIRVEVAPKTNVWLDLETTIPPVYAPNDSRTLHYAIRDLNITAVP